MAGLSSHIKRNARVFGVGLTLAAALLAAALYGALSLMVPAPRDGDREVRIPRGTGYAQALRLFRQEGVISSEFPLRVLGRLTRVERAVHPGVYRVIAEETPLEVFRKIQAGDIEVVHLTIPEGFSLAEVSLAVERNGLGTSGAFLQAAHDPSFVKRLELPAPSFEGFLFPDTYRVSVDASPKELIAMMVGRFRSVFDETLQARLAESDLNLLEAVTLASIVEKEAAQDSERPYIAAVFLNRLKKGMRLEADPTILYGVRPLGGAPIRRSEIKRRTPYNTYVIRGLPPGPIANPGLASLRAVLYPAETDHLYFVAQNDGTHKFSSTLKEHNHAVRRFRRGG